MPAAPIEVFRPGRHVAMGGDEILFGLADMAATVAAYNPAVHEAPIVVGHPAHDQPAYGWVKGLRIEDGGLVAELGDVDPDFADLVRARRYAKVSASFYRPDAPANPRPGVWSLRHVGFLGAMPPAVKGLKPVQFGAGQAGVIEFADALATPIAASPSSTPEPGGEGADPVELARRARDHQARMAELGIQITSAAAVRAVLDGAAVA